MKTLLSDRDTTNERLRPKNRTGITYFAVITLEAPSCQRQETANGSFGLKESSYHLYHTRLRLHTVPFNAERHAGKLWYRIAFSSTRSGTEPESTVLLSDAYPLNHCWFV